MVWFGDRSASLLEVTVVLFQVMGVATLVLYRLFPSPRWQQFGRLGFIFALLGLGIAGAICGGQDSEFALFAGGTMTFLLIGMTAGNGHVVTTASTAPLATPEPVPAG